MRRTVLTILCLASVITVVGFERNLGSLVWALIMGVTIYLTWRNK